jgi:hypothetical protein
VQESESLAYVLADGVPEARMKLELLTPAVLTTESENARRERWKQERIVYRDRERPTKEDRDEDARPGERRVQALPASAAARRAIPRSCTRTQAAGCWAAGTRP